MKQTSLLTGYSLLGWSHSCVMAISQARSFALTKSAVSRSETTIGLVCSVDARNGSLRSVDSDAHQITISAG